MKYCCDTFEAFIGEAGQRGFSIIAIDELGVEFFAMQGRSSNDDGSIFQTGLPYCPFCGTKLSRLIRKQTQAFRDLAQEHKQYALSS